MDIMLHSFLAVLSLCALGFAFFYSKKNLFTRDSIRKSLFDSLGDLPIGAYVRHVKGTEKRYIFSNPIVQDIYGHKEIFNAPSWNQAEDDEADSALISGGMAYNSKEKVILTADNTQKYVVVHKKKLFICPKEFIIVTTLLDVTQQKKDQVRLEENQIDISLAMSAGKMFLWRYNTLKQEFVTLLGTAPLRSGLLLHDILPKMYPDDRQPFADLLAKLAGTDTQEEEITFRAAYVDADNYSYYRCKMIRYYDPIDNQVYIVGSQRDITKGRLKELELRNIRRSLDMAISAADIIAWDYNIQEKSYRNLYGMYETEFVQEEDGKFADIHPDDRDVYIHFVQRLILGESPDDKGTLQIRVRQKQEDYRYYKCVVQTIRDASGKPCSLIGLFMDITKQVESETLIQQKAEFLHTVLDNIPFPTHVKDIENDCKYLYWNKASKTLFGDCQDERCEKLLTPEQAVKIEAQDKAIYDSGMSYQEQEKLYLKDGRVFDTIVYKNVIYDGVKKFILTVRWDIGELLRLQRYLEDVCRRDEIIINNTNSGLAYITSDYMVQWENISLCTPERVYETYRKGEFCYKSAYGRDSACEDCLLKRVMISKNIEHREFSLNNGRDIEVLANPVLKKDGEIEGIVIRVDDITDRLKMIEELRSAKEKAEESDKLKSAFLANISHEIRTPLNAIVGFSDLLIHAENTADKEQFVKIISTNNELLLRLINDIVDLSIIESGMINLREREVDITGLLNELKVSYIFKVREGVRLISDTPSGKYLFYTDSERLKQVMTHFLINAIKFTEKGFIKLGYEFVDGGVRCYVEDTGIGVGEKHQDKIFEHFEKVNSFSQGTGLGLSICKAIVDACHGKIGVDSQEGKGSTFWIWLPGACVAL